MRRTLRFTIDVDVEDLCDSDRKTVAEEQGLDSPGHLENLEWWLPREKSDVLGTVVADALDIVVVTEAINWKLMGYGIQLADDNFRSHCAYFLPASEEKSPIA